jgi:hypothetical protein
MEEGNMNNRFGQAVLITGIVLFLTIATASPLFARTSSHTKSGDIDVIYPSKIASGPELQPGTYKVELDSKATSPEILFYQNSKLVAQAPAKLVDEGKKSDQTEVFYSTVGSEHVITQIDLQGWTQEVMFEPSRTAGMGS